MPTKVNVNGKIVSRPGVYSSIKSGIKNPALGLDYGNVCIIDTSLLGGYAAGAGITGTYHSGADSVYSFDNIEDFRKHVKGGDLWLLAEPLFYPNGVGSKGVSRVDIIKAATTTAATGTFTGTTSPTSLVFKSVDEGTGANGVLTSSNLSTGFAFKVKAGLVDTAKYMFEFYKGTYKGADSQNSNLPYDGITAAVAVPELVIRSAEFSTVTEAITWFTSDVAFNEKFRLHSSAGTAFHATDLVTYASYTLFASGTETYDSTAFDAALLQAKDLDCTFFLSVESGSNATSVANVKIFDYITQEAKYEKFLFVGGGADSTKFAPSSVANSSAATAAYYNSDRVCVVHGGIKKSIANSTSQKTYNQLYHTALVLGRAAGSAPQVPLTLKAINIDGEVHALTEAQQETALKAGIIYSYKDRELGAFVIGQGVTSLLNNDYLVNEDGTSFSLAVKRVCSQLNKEIQTVAKRTFFSSENGPNRATITEEDIKAWLGGYLSSKVAETLKDNLITKWQNINVSVNQDNYSVTYEFVPNFEVNKMIFTGFMLSK